MSAHFCVYGSQASCVPGTATLDVNVPSYYADYGVIIGGQMQNQTSREFQTEMDMFNQAFLEVLAAGDARERGFTFPIPTDNISSN